MTNEKALRSAIGTRNLDISDVIAMCGFNRQNFYNKLKNKREFKQSEIFSLVNALKLTTDETNAIFFGKCVD